MPRLIPVLKSLALLAVLLAPLPATATGAETPLTAEEFEAHVTGRTITYASGGMVYGAEEYQPGRRVRWSFAGGECQEGIWYPEDRFICFVYRENPVPQCWTFFREGDGLRALFNDTPGDTELTEVDRTDRPLVCAGPDVGV